MGSDQIKGLANDLINAGKLRRNDFEQAMENITEKFDGQYLPIDNDIRNGDMDESAFVTYMREKTKTDDDSLDKDIKLLFSVIKGDDDVLSSDEFVSAFDVNGDEKVASFEMSTSIKNSRKLDSGAEASTSAGQTSQTNSAGEVTLSKEDIERTAKNLEGYLRNGDSEMFKYIVENAPTDGDLAAILCALQDGLGEGESIISLYNGEKIGDNEWSGLCMEGHTGVPYTYPVADKMWQRVKNAAKAGNEDALLVLARETEYIVREHKGSNPFINNIFGLPHDYMNYPDRPELEPDVDLIRMVVNKHDEISGETNRLRNALKNGQFTWYGEEGTKEYLTILDKAGNPF